MTNDRYLIISYFAVAALAIAFGGATWFFLRRPFGGIVQALSNGNLSRLIRVMFPAGLFFPALLGFFAVSYRGCGKPYDEIVKDRAYLIQKNHEQLSSILLWIAAALLFWDLVILLALKFARANDRHAKN
jgi:hypothetical protein